MKMFNIFLKTMGVFIVENVLLFFSTKTVNLKSVKNEKKIYYHLNYSLNLEQERTSRLLIERYQNHQNSVLKAVTGAGKMENDLWCH